MSTTPTFLSARLRQPALPQKIVPRAGIYSRLEEGLAQGRAVTLVSAPAGFGKTTALSAWLAETNLPVAWLSLDADDNEPVRFFTLLIAALRSVAEPLPNLAEVEGILRSGQLPPLESITGALLEDITLLETSRFLLVLDDFHLIQDRSILKVFEKLITGLFSAHAASPLHLILLTREDPALPLSRLRAGGLLTEVRAEDLRFQAEEARQFLNDVLNLALPTPEIAALEQKTEGWAAGLQLAGLSLRGHPDPARFIAGLSGSNRFILGYLTEEVLSRQTEDIQNFLLSTAILDRLTGDLCDAVTGRSDSHLLLEQLWNANLFLVPLDEEQHWYRYHHLFADLLRGRQSKLHKDQTAGLHRRAGQWYARSAVNLPPAEQAVQISTAIQHFLAGEEYTSAVGLIETYAMDILNQWYAKTITGWIQALPPALIEQSPMINLVFARTALMQNGFAQAMPYINRLQSMFSGDQRDKISPQVAAGWLGLQSTLLGAQGSPAEALALAQRAVEIAPDGDNNAQSQAYLALAVAHQQLDHTVRAEEAYHRLIQLGQASGSFVMELLGRSALALMLIQRGRLREGYDLAIQGIERVERSGVLPPMVAGLYGELGQVAFHWLDLEQADAYLRRASQVSTLGGFSDSDIFYSVFRSRACHLRGDLDGAQDAINKAAGLMKEDAPIVVREEVIAQQIVVALARNQHATAEAIFSSSVGPLSAEEMTYQQGVLHNCGLRILVRRLLQGRTSVEDVLPGLEMAAQLLAFYQRKQYVPHMIEALLLRAQLYAAAREPQPSIADLTAALDLAEPEGYLSQFVAEGEGITGLLVDLLPRLAPGSSRAAFVQRILDSSNTRPRAAGAKPSAPTGLFEPLTGREIEVLQRLAEGQTYEEIAAGLVVSINTIRTHVKAIYGKLGVNNRTAAIEMARRMQLL